MSDRNSNGTPVMSAYGTSNQHLHVWFVHDEGSIRRCTRLALMMRMRRSIDEATLILEQSPSAPRNPEERRYLGMALGMRAVGFHPEKTNMILQGVRENERPSLDEDTVQRLVTRAYSSTCDDWNHLVILRSS
jgi:hypothetical protein